MQTGWETSVQAVAAKRNKIFNIIELVIPTGPTPLCERVSLCTSGCLGTTCVAQAGLKHRILTPPPKCWDYRHALPMETLFPLISSLEITKYVH